jgi:VanZ family protein
MSKSLLAYRSIFWIGYFAVLVTTFIPVAGELNKIHIGPDAFHIRLDHLLHFAVYFLICMYYLAGQKIGLNLFTANPLTKFIILVLFLAASTEVVQLWVPARTFNVFDLISNVAGLVIGTVLILMARRNDGLAVTKRL